MTNDKLFHIRFTPAAQTPIDENSREERLARIIELGREVRDDGTNVIEMFPEKERRSYVLNVDDLIYYGTMGFLLVSLAAVIIDVGRSDQPASATRPSAPRPPEPTEELPYDVWSFLGSRNGRAFLDGTFRTVQRYLNSR